MRKPTAASSRHQHHASGDSWWRWPPSSATIRVFMVAVATLWLWREVFGENGRLRGGELSLSWATAPGLRGRIMEDYKALRHAGGEPNNAAPGRAHPSPPLAVLPSLSPAEGLAPDRKLDAVSGSSAPAKDEVVVEDDETLCRHLKVTYGVVSAPLRRSHSRLFSPQHRPTHVLDVWAATGDVVGFHDPGRSGPVGAPGLRPLLLSRSKSVV